MRRETLRALASCLAALLSFASPHGSAHADEPVPRWGVAAYTADGKFVAARWLDDAEASVGSAPDATLQLPGIASDALRIRAAQRRFELEPGPGATVTVDGAPIAGRTAAAEGALIGVERFRLRLFRPTQETPAETSSASEPGLLSRLGLSGDEAPQDASAGSAPDPTSAGAEAAVARADEFARSGYRFCHDPEFGAEGTVGWDFCAIFDESSAEVCPATARSCPWKPAPVRESGGAGALGPGRSRPEPRRRLLELPEPPAIPRELGYLLLFALLAPPLFALLRALHRARQREAAHASAAPDALDQAERDLQALPGARCAALLARAERALNEQRSEEAALFLHLAVLRHLDDEGLARFHPSRTNGDYLRAIRGHGELARLFEGVARQTERVRFGDGTADPEALARALAEARALLVARRSPSGASGLALLLLAAPALDACKEPDLAPAFYSMAPSGMSALVPILEGAGLRAELLRGGLAELPEDTGALVIATSAAGGRAWPEALELDQALDRSISVVLIDDARLAPALLPVTATAASSLDRVVGLRLAATASVSPCGAYLARLDDPLPAEPLKLPRGRRLLTETSSRSALSPFSVELAPLFDFADASGRRATGAALSAVRRDPSGEPLPGCLYVFADRDPFTNAALTRRASARFVAGFFAALVPEGRRIVVLQRIDASTGGGGEAEADEPSPARALSASNAAPFLMQGLVTLALFLIFMGAAFGPLRDPPRTEHKAFVEHVEAIGRQYARLGEAGLAHAATALARLLVMRERERGTTTSGGWSALAAELAQRHGLPEARVRAALRLGLGDASELGPSAPDDAAQHGATMLETLSTLLGARARGPAARTGRREPWS
jgi:hypothetical protein